MIEPIEDMDITNVAAHGHKLNQIIDWINEREAEYEKYSQQVDDVGSEPS